MIFRPNDQLNNELTRQAELEQTSVQDLLARAAQEYLDRRAKKSMVRAEVALVKENFADALKRLDNGA